MAVMTVVMVLMEALVGLIMALTPWIMPPTECFTVTIPPSAHKDPRIVQAKRTFSCIVLGITAIVAGGLALFVNSAAQSSVPSADEATLISAAVTCATLAPLAAGMLLMLRYRSTVQALKQQEGWVATSNQAAATLADDFPKPISLAWNLLYVPIVLAMVAIALTGYDRLPDQIPMNVDATGTVVSYAQKSLGAALFPAMTTAFLGFVFSFSHWMIIVSKRPVDPAAPATSSLSYGRFARLQSISMLVGGVLLSSALGITFYLAAFEVLSMQTAAIVITVAVVAIVVAQIAISIMTGQAGGRLSKELRPNDELLQDNDKHWPLGIFYANADDPSVVVPKRFGVGWTINVAQPAAWGIIGCLALFILVFSLFAATFAA